MPSTFNRFLESLPLAPTRPWIGYCAAMVLSLFALAARWLLDPVFPPGFPYLTFFPAVILTSFLFGRNPGIFAAVLCGLLAWYFFIPPFNSFALVPGTAVALAFYCGVVAVDILLIHWMQHANERLRAERLRSQQLADHAELLFHELQHRVSNNLQMIGAVLSLQRRAVTDPQANQALGDAVAKLQTIGRIQRQLYSPDGGRLGLDRFLPDLVGDLIRSGGHAGISHAVEVEPGVEIDPQAAIPVALVMAEAVANAVEHGFAGRERGNIHVRVLRAADHIDLTVTDDGVGPPAGFDVAIANSLGLRIARTLAGQLEGSFGLHAGEAGGAVARLRIPAPHRIA